MARGNQVASDASKSALGYSQNLQGQQGSLYGTLAPSLEADIAHPTGLTPEEKATANTAAQESAGGSMAGATGQGGLMAARTRNAGGADAAIQESAREGGRQVSRAALGTELEDTELKQRKAAAAKGELGQLYGISTQGGNQALEAVAPNVNANTNSENASWNWAKYILDPALEAAGKAGGAAAGGCWIAETIYGVDDIRTHLLRAWLNGPFSEHLSGKCVMFLYGKFGRWIAERPRIAKLFKPLFEIALQKAL